MSNFHTFPGESIHGDNSNTQATTHFTFPSSANALVPHEVSSSRDESQNRRWQRTSIDDDANRKAREDRTVQVRKDKRNDLANSRRHKVCCYSYLFTIGVNENPYDQISDEGMSLSVESTARRREDILRGLDSLTDKSKLIYSENSLDLEIATEYFRRLLSIGEIISNIRRHLLAFI